MNAIEYQMIDVLKELKEKHNVFEVKAEFEAEGSRMEEMMRLKDITGKVDLPIILKIGGVEAITDIYNALSIGVKGIIAPMAETPYSVAKFLNVIETFVADDNRMDIEFAINVETETTFQNLDKILSLPRIKSLQAITIGRVDMVGSMGLERNMVNSQKILEMCQAIFGRARSMHLRTGLGGGISTESIEFIRKLHDQALVDKYETRKVVFSADSIVEKEPEKGILKAVEFELLWLKSKRRYYSRIKVEDEHRIEMLEKRLGA